MRIKSRIAAVKRFFGDMPVLNRVPRRWRWLKWGRKGDARARSGSLS
jgi:hypothetical protein